MGGIIQTATGNGHVQVGGKIETGAGARIGGVHIGREVITVEEGQAIWQSNDRDLVELIALLRDYGTPKMLAELRDKLLQVKKAVEGG
ncbi:hypothetical protein [Desulfuromonas soudanensis]|uniref:hypothetical protein n=1 Tax=Desulfuromonas soudanensis TaxID=1603606 RepID=UPI001E60E318|nr:hypothetical protein [Desulfuromonas soudanensis]